MGAAQCGAPRCEVARNRRRQAADEGVWYPPMHSMRPKPGARPLQRAYLRQPEPVHFPTEAEVPETGVHFELRTALFSVLRLELQGKSYVGSDQFLYWDATNPKLCVSPDITVRLGAPDLPLPCLKVWEFGAPELAIEIVSRADSGAPAWDVKVSRYRAAGISEVVRFDPEDAESPLRIWDRIEGDLVERDPSDPLATFCDTLELWWQVTADARHGRNLRLSRDAAGKDLLLSPLERLALERAAKEAERSAKESERSAKESERAAKEAALLRVAELEAQLARR
jgi:Uma2 family endonuclease